MRGVSDSGKNSVHGGNREREKAVARAKRDLYEIETALVEQSDGDEECTHSSSNHKKIYGYGDIWRDRTAVKALMIGCGLQLIQQLAGINTVMYYSASIAQVLYNYCMHLTHCLPACLPYSFPACLPVR